MAAVRPAGPEPTMISLLSVRPGDAAAKPGPPGAVATAGPPKSMVRSDRGAGAAGAATDVSAEKSIARPPKGSAELGAASSALVSVAAPGLLPSAPPAPTPGRRTESSVCCLLIDASLTRRQYPPGVWAAGYPRGATHPSAARAASSQAARACRSARRP